jgi:hypothetical protein
VNAAAWRAEPSSDRLLTKPTSGIAGCCARAASGHAAAPPSSVMNSRRFMSDNGPSSSPVPMRAKTAAAAIGLPAPAYRGMADRPLGQYLNCSNRPGSSQTATHYLSRVLFENARQGWRGLAGG